MLVLLSLIAADPPMQAGAIVKLTDRRLVTSEEPAAPRRSPYRLDPNIAGPADGKAAAVAMTGEKCAVTGPKLCTRKARTVFAASY